MKTEELHENYILLHNFEHGVPMKKWVEADVNNIGEYHTSWDWVMPVVKKIESMPGWYVKTEGNYCSISHGGSAPIITETDGTKILALYKGVLEFVKWYNKYTKQPV